MYSNQVVYIFCYTVDIRDSYRLQFVVIIYFSRCKYSYVTYDFVEVQTADLTTWERLIYLLLLTLPVVVLYSPLTSLYNGAI